MHFDGVEHFDHFEDETLYWINLSDMPEPLQQAARKIDGTEYHEKCFGMCVSYDMTEKRFIVTEESDGLTGTGCNVFYIDKDGDKHWFQADLPDSLLKAVIDTCKELQNGAMLGQGDAVLNTAPFDNNCGKGMDRRVAGCKRIQSFLEPDTTCFYPNSQSEARRFGELDLWQASFQANVSCAREIESAIRIYGDKNGMLKSEASQAILARWGFIRTNFVLANSVGELGFYKEQLSAENLEWKERTYVPPDAAHNRYFIVDTALAYLDAFIGQVREAYGRLELFDSEHCEPDSYKSLDYEGRVLVLSPNVLKESYWSQENQLWLAHDGFGCSPHAIGRSIRCTCLGDGEMTRWNRADFTGILKEEFLPQWAKEKLEKLTGHQPDMSTIGGMNME